MEQERFILACSGGLDSMVMAHLSAVSRYDFALAHCNFQLRNTDSDADEELVRASAQAYGVPFFVSRFDTLEYVNKNKVSVQMAARELRYAWFAKLQNEHNIKWLVTAHHADDALETFMINLSRGTGIDGLTGIPAKTKSIARPLLAFSKVELESYANANKIDWREDKSNAETKYLRNKIRHELVPGMKELHPTFLDNFKRSLRHLENTASLVHVSIENIRAALFEEKEGVIHIDSEALLQLHPLEAYVYQLFKAYGFTAWEDICSLISATSGKEVRSRTHRLVKDRNALLLSKLEAQQEASYLLKREEQELLHPVRLKVEEVEAITEITPEVLYVDKKTLKYPLTVRKWKNGDYFYPLGMHGKKKLSKYFKDEKIDVISKGKQWLLCSGDAIIWVIGRRADDRFKVTEDTHNIIKISLNK